MTGQALESRLHRVASRLYKLRILRRQTYTWLMLLIPAALVVCMIPRQRGMMLLNLIVLTFVTVIGLIIARWKVSQPSAIETARLVEQKRPNLNDAVITAVHAVGRLKTEPSVLNEVVIQEADRLAIRDDWRSVVPRRSVFLWSTLSFIAFCFMVTSVVAASRYGRDFMQSAAPSFASNLPSPTTPDVISDLDMEVEPGNTEVELGSALTVIARFRSQSPSHATLELTSESGTEHFVMDSTVDEGIFGTRIPSVSSDATYRVLYANQPIDVVSLDSEDSLASSEQYTIETYVLPRVDQVDALITPPAYTNREPQLIEDTLRATAVEGSEVEFAIHVNKEITVAELRSEDNVLPLPPVERDPTNDGDEAGGRGSRRAEVVDPAAQQELRPPATASSFATLAARITATDNRKLEIYLEDEDGRTLREPVIISLKVTRNKRPKIKVTFPGRDSNISPLQEFHIEAEAADDFGFTDFGVMYSLSGGDSTELSLMTDNESGGAQSDNNTASHGAETLSERPTGAVPSGSSNRLAGRPASGKLKIQHMIDMEQLNAKPDQLLSYSFYVEDAAADGTSRRTYSDMMFAEVRRFEEIFRESQQQSQQQQQQQQQQQSPSDELLKLQREITIATWNTRRTLNESRSHEIAVRKAVTDSEVILESQLVALQQLAEIQQEAAGDEQMAQLAANVQEHMESVVETLTKITSSHLPDGEDGGRRPDEGDAASTNNTSDSLTSALTSEQSAIAGLMRMRAREHEVRRSQQSQSQGQGQQNSASQQQLRQLELKNDRERYESERQAQEQQEQNAEQREQLQILSRLKELARRQQMLNDRLKQLESELRAAETDKEREEIERELKRLREEQRELLRDVDELRQTMDQQSAEQQEANQQARDQVEQARQQVQQASQALDEGKLSEAIAEGTRAERQFDELQEQFRKQTSSQFSEAMRDLRQQARDMMERQDEIARDLNKGSESDTSPDQTGPASLRSDRNRDELEEKVSQQRDNLERVLEQAKGLVEQAEDSEPLLSNRLFETINNTREQRPDEALQAAEILVSRGLYDQGQQAEQIARKGLDELSKGIEKAADAVLGSEAESLRRAQREIEELTEQLSSEVAEATGQEPSGGVGERESGREGEKPEDNGRNEQQNGEGQAGSERRGIQRVASPQPNQNQRQSGQGNQEAQEGGNGQRQPQDQEDGSERQSGGDDSERMPQENEQPREGQQGEGEAQGQQGGRRQSENDKPSERQQSQGEQQQGEQQQGEPSETQSGEQQGQQSGEAKQSQQSGQQSGGQQQGNQQSGEQQNPNGQQPGGQQGQSGQQRGSSEQGSSQQGSQQQGGRQQGGQRQQGQNQNSLMNGGRESNTGRGANQGRPLTGDDYRDWSNRMREVEETLDDPELRNQVAKVRDRARSIRAEFRRHGKEPEWDLVQSELLDEMIDLQSRIAQELSKIDNDRSMAPIDREPVPEEFDELVRRYYELLGQSRSEDE